MELFKIEKTFIEDLVVIHTLTHSDERGHFVKTFDEEIFQQYGLPTSFSQDDQSKSKKGVLRGLHFLKHNPQGKLIRVSHGRIFDVAVDLRKNSLTYTKWYGLELSDSNNKLFYIPPGFAHGFLSLEDDSVILYKCTSRYYPEYDLGILWNDKTFNISWPLDKVDELIISQKDKGWKTFEELNITF